PAPHALNAFPTRRSSDLSDYGVTNGGLGSRHIYVGDVLQPYSQAAVARTKCTVTAVTHSTATITVTPDPVTTAGDFFARATKSRSEEHTSELQSLRHLVC